MVLLADLAADRGFVNFLLPLVLLLQSRPAACPSLSFELTADFFSAESEKTELASGCSSAFGFFAFLPPPAPLQRPRSAACPSLRFELAADGLVLVSSFSSACGSWLYADETDWPMSVARPSARPTVARAGGLVLAARADFASSSSGLYICVWLRLRLPGTRVAGSQRRGVFREDPDGSACFAVELVAIGPPIWLVMTHCVGSRQSVPCHPICCRHRKASLKLLQ